MRVADYLISFLYDRLKIDTIFMVSGGGIMHMTDAIACHGRMRYICSHNEQATTMEADGYAKQRGDFGVALVTTGPGATNAITGVVGAWQDSTTVIVISGQSKRLQTIYNSKLDGLRQFGVQEAHVLPMIETITKYSAMIDDPQKIKYHLEKAVFLAKSGRPGPVWLDIPLDVQGALIDPDKLEGFNPVEESADSYNIHDQKIVVKQVLKDIATAKRPIIMAGHGVRIAKAVDALNALVQKVNIPVVTPRLGIDLMDTNNPRYVGRPGIKGDRAANFAVQNADYILCIGTRLSINVTGHEYRKFAREAKIVVVDVDVIEHQKPTIKIDQFIQCDALEFIELISVLADEMGIVRNNDWIETCQKWKAKYPVVLPEYKHQNPINTYYFSDVLSNLLDPSDTVIIDSGSSSYVVSQSIKIKYGQRYIASGGLGAMGYGLPAAIGASAAKGNKRVICITGDGSLQMNIQELQTVSHEKMCIKLFIFNNGGYASIKTTQHNYFNDRFIGVDEKSGVPIPDTLKIAELYGIKGVRVEKTEDIAKIITHILNEAGPVICDVICSPNQPIIPTVYSVKKNDGSMASRPLEDMYPFLDREEFKREMIIDPLED